MVTTNASSTVKTRKLRRGIKNEIKDRLNDQFGITHSTLEFEHENRAHENADLYGHGNPEKQEEDHVHRDPNKS